MNKSNRRQFLVAATAGLFAAGAGPASARLFKKPEGDGPFLADLLEMEHRAVFACGLLKGSPRVTEEAEAFCRALQQTHQEHASVLTDAIRKLGETLPELPNMYRFDQPSDSEKQVMTLISHQERLLADAYIDRMERYHDRNLANQTATMLADCVLHLAVLRHALDLSPVHKYRDLQA